MSRLAMVALALAVVFSMGAAYCTHDDDDRLQVLEAERRADAAWAHFHPDTQIPAAPHLWVDGKDESR